MKKEFPKVIIEKLEITENNFVRSKNESWNCTTLIEHSKKFKIFDLPLAGISLYGSPWGSIESLDSFMYHIKRIENTSLTHPILLDDYGQICDGWHRVCKAILKGDTTIKAIRLETMP